MSSQTSSRTNIILLQIKLIFGISDSFNFKSDDIKDGKNERDKEALFESKTFLNALFPILYDSIDLWTSVFSLSFFCSSLSKFVFKLCWDIISKFEILRSPVTRSNQVITMHSRGNSHFRTTSLHKLEERHLSGSILHSHTIRVKIDI